jgi:hypothetical protein
MVMRITSLFIFFYTVFLQRSRYMVRACVCLCLCVSVCRSFGLPRPLDAWLAEEKKMLSRCVCLSHFLLGTISLCALIPSPLRDAQLTRAQCWESFVGQYVYSVFIIVFSLEILLCLITDPIKRFMAHRFELVHKVGKKSMPVCLGVCVCVYVCGWGGLVSSWSLCLPVGRFSIFSHRTRSLTVPQLAGVPRFNTVNNTIELIYSQTIIM